MQEARRICDRLRRVGRNGLEIAKALEKNWKDALKSAIKDTKWYKERFPRQVEREQREKQYERYRMRPDLYYQDWLGDRDRGPEDIRVPSRRAAGFTIIAQALDKVNEAIQGANSAIVNLISKYFAKSQKNPLLEASNEAVKGLRRKPIMDRLRQQGREDQVRVLETLFGFKNQPGQFIEVGGEAFLAPALQELNHAQEYLKDPIGAPQDIADAQAKIKEFQDRDDSPPGEEGPGGTPPEEGTDPAGDAPTGEEAPAEPGEEMEYLDLTGTEDKQDALEKQVESPEKEEFDPEKTQKMEWQGFEPEPEPEEFDPEKTQKIEWPGFQKGTDQPADPNKKPRWKTKSKKKKPPTESELNKILERQNQLIRRQQRYHLAQRIASN